MADQSQQQSKPPIRLTVPSPDSVANPNVETRPNKLAKWVEDLPYANPIKVEAEIFESLYQLNRYPDEVPQRSELMVCYRKAYDSLFHVVRKEYMRKDFRTVHHGKLELANLLLKVTVEMAYGYKLVINECLERISQGKKEPHLGLAIYFVMKSLTQELMLEYAEFIPDSKKAWREIFQLYSLAEEHDLERELMEEGKTIELLFKRILLIVMVDPYHLHRGEIWSCYDYLARWALLTKFEPLEQMPANLTAHFLVDFQSVHPPKPLKEDAELVPGRHYIFNTMHLCETVHKHLKQVEQNSKFVPDATEKLTSIQATQMFRHMLLAWHVQPERRSPREEKYGAHMVASGLSAAKHFMEMDTIVQQEAFNPFLDHEEEEPQGLTIEGTGGLQSAPKTGRYHIYEWRIFNISASGVGLIVNAPVPKEVQVGQLLVIQVQRKETKKNCSVGIVRRMIQRDPETMEVGVQFIAGQVTPVALRHQVFGSEVPAEFQSGLLVEGSKTPSTILAPYGMFRPRQEYVVDLGKQVLRVFANKLLESTPAFDRFTFDEMKATLAPELI
jgi:hypothetical protein